MQLVQSTPQSEIPPHEALTSTEVGLGWPPNVSRETLHEGQKISEQKIGLGWPQ